MMADKRPEESPAILEPLLELSTKSVANLILFEDAFIAPGLLETMTYIVNNLLLHIGTCPIHSRGRMFEQTKKMWLHLTVYRSRNDREMSLIEFGFVRKMLMDLRAEMIKWSDLRHSEMLVAIQKLIRLQL